MAKVKDYNQSAADFLKKRLNVKPKTAPETTPAAAPTQDNSRTPFFDSRNNKLLGFDYKDGRVALEKGSISNNSLDAQGKPVSSLSPNAVDPNSVPQAPPPVLPSTQDILKSEGIGTIDTSLDSQVTADILQNQNQRQALPNVLTGPQSFEEFKTNPAGTLLGPTSGVIPKITSTLITGKKDSFIKNLGLPRSVESYLSDYSNAGSFEQITTDLEIADTQISVAKKAANAGDEPLQAIRVYNAAQSRKALALRQLKLLSKDQKKYSGEVIKQMTMLQAYFDDEKRYDDLEMASAVQKALAVQNG